MILVAAFVGGAAGAAVLWALLAPAFGAEVFTRQNFRDRDLPTGVGVIVALVVVCAHALVVVLDVAGTDPSGRMLTGMMATTILAVGFALLGLLDDLGGVGQSGGFRGHLRELTRGRLTTGAAKLFGGAALGLIAASVRTDSLWKLLVAGALIALTANLGNLFDRAPGRAIKVSLLAGLVVLIWATTDSALTGVALVLGAGAGLLWPDLREQMMLGDAGANVLGAAVGLGVVLTFGPPVWVGALVVVAGLNAASEVVSFSKVINRVAPLRAVDQLGRQP